MGPPRPAWPLPGRARLKGAAGVCGPRARVEVWAGRPMCSLYGCPPSSLQEVAVPLFMSIYPLWRSDRTNGAGAVLGARSFGSTVWGPVLKIVLQSLEGASEHGVGLPTVSKSEPLSM